MSSLQHLIHATSPDFIFLAEPQLFQHDLLQVMEFFKGDYHSSLNSQDKDDPEFALVNTKSYGGTMVMWKRSHDPYITVIPTSSTSYLPIVFQPTGSKPSLHISVYLPTAGKDTAFIDELSKLQLTIEEFTDKFPENSIYIRGDMNVNNNNIKRKALLKHFKIEIELSEVHLTKKTYHHFVGEGKFDSQIDVLLYSDSSLPESLQKQFCIYDFPFLNSHHDVLLSSFSLKIHPSSPNDMDNIIAPRIVNNRHKIHWSDENLLKYQQTLSTELKRTREFWSNPSNKSTLSVLLQTTNDILSLAASSTNKVTILNKPFIPKNKKPHKEVTNAHKQLMHAQCT